MLDRGKAEAGAAAAVRANGAGHAIPCGLRRHIMRIVYAKFMRNEE